MWPKSGHLPSFFCSWPTSRRRAPVARRPFSQAASVTRILVSSAWSMMAGGGVEQGGVPFALRETARHQERLLVGMEPQHFHQAVPRIGVADLRDFARRIFAPGETLPGLFAVAGHRIDHRPHAAHEQFPAIRAEGQIEDAADIVVALDDAPAGEIRRGPGRRPVCRSPDPTRAPRPSGSRRRDSGCPG